MARKCELILGLNDSKPVWKIDVRVVDLWYVQKNPQQGHLEMIVMDEKGDKIQVGVKNEEFVHWSPKLKEQSTYVMQNLSIAPNKGKYKACEHQYKLFFTDCTTLKEMDIPAIPLFKYNFKKFSDINAGIYNKDNLVDIIGGVDKIITTHPAGKLQKAVVVLKDLSGDFVQCTLWEELATQFVRYLAQRTDPTGTIIIILTKAKIKEPQGKFPAEVSNSWNSSKLLINEECIDIQNFKTIFVPSETQQPSSQMVSQMSAGSSQFTEQDRFLYKTQAMTVFDITNHVKEEVSNIVTVGTTVTLMPNKNGWYYEGCSTCTRRAESLNGPFTCQGMHYSEKSVPRYKLDIKVVHKNGSGKFIFWDQQCTQFIGKSALILKNEMLAAGEDNPMVYPEDCDRMLYRTLALRVKVSPKYQNSSVQKQSEDKAIIQAILDQLPTDESQGTSKDDKVMVNPEDSVQFETQSLSATSENDPDLIASITPAKRNSQNNASDAEQSPNIGSAQLSTTKLTKHIKEGVTCGRRLGCEGLVF